MRQSDLQPRKRYAYRATASRNDLNLIKVTVVGPGRGRKVRVRYEDGELAGLDEWVPIVQIVCPWSERKAFLADHARQRELEQASSLDYERVTEDAICTVMTASGEESGFTFIWATDPATATRLWSRAGLEGSPLDDHPANYSDRHGTWHMSFATAERVSKAFAAAEPELVELYVAGWEKRLTAEGFLPGQRHAHSLLRDWAPQHALARSWANAPEARALTAEVERLQRLVHYAIDELSAHGHPEAAARLRRSLRGG